MNCLNLSKIKNLLIYIKNIIIHKLNRFNSSTRKQTEEYKAQFQCIISEKNNIKTFYDIEIRNHYQTRYAYFEISSYLNESYFKKEKINICVSKLSSIGEKIIDLEIDFSKINPTSTLINNEPISEFYTHTDKGTIVIRIGEDITKDFGTIVFIYNRSSNLPKN